MRLVTFLPQLARDARQPVEPRTGVVVGEAGSEQVVDLTDPVVGLPSDMVALLAAGPGAVESAAGAATTGARRWDLGEVRLLAPVLLPPKVLAIGLNYRAHIEEMGREPPAHQYWFNKQRTAVTGPDAPIVIPSVSDQVDYEGELALVIRHRAHGVPASRWLDVVAGFTVLNDVSVRDWQKHSPTFTMGKSFDTHCPMGPWIVTPDEVPDAMSLTLRTWVNGELRQDASTSDFLFTPPEMVEYLTTAFPLEPGDVISTGTPAGVGAGFDPPKWLRPGDTVRIEIGKVGVLENPVAPHAGDAAAG
ncbi:MAG: fumarylacetoacetate hydrolase family protein [Acidimicrobiales bacterium]